MQHWTEIGLSSQLRFSKVWKNFGMLLSVYLVFLCIIINFAQTTDKFTFLQDIHYQ